MGGVTAGKKRASVGPLPPLRSARGEAARAEAENGKVTGTTGSEERYAGTTSPEMTKYSVLFISANSATADKLEGLLRDDEALAVECARVESLFDGLRSIQDRQFDLVLSELFLPDGQGLATLRHLQQHAPKTPVILLCHTQDRDTAVTAVRKGAHDFFCYEELDPVNFQRSVQNALSSTGGPSPSNKEAERRNNARFDCHLAVSYQTLEKPFISGQGESETLNISSKGVLFRASEALEPGQLVQVSVDWPARLENQIPLKLVAEGRIVRNIKGVAAMTIEKYEFRTRRVSAQAAGQSKAAASADGKTPSRSSEAAPEGSSRPGTAAGGSAKGV
jgi:DNA-binding NarL/FixJ family response regulator